MRGTTRFQPDPGRCQPIEELPDLAAPELTADNRLLILIDAVHLKNMLGGIQTNSDNRHGTAPLAALHTSQPGTIDAVGGRPPQHHVSSHPHGYPKLDGSMPRIRGRTYCAGCPKAPIV